MAISDKFKEQLRDLVNKELEDFENDIEEVKDNIVDLEDRFNNQNNTEDTQPSQLSLPLDSYSKRIIRKQSTTPLTDVLNGSQAASAGNYGVFFVNRTDRAMVVDEIVEIHGTAGSDSGDVTLQVERLQDTESSGNGDDLLSTAFDLKASANTVQNGELVNDNSLLVIEPNDRLGLSLTGTPTSVDDLVVTVYLQQ